MTESLGSAAPIGLKVSDVFSVMRGRSYRDPKAPPGKSGTVRILRLPDLGRSGGVGPPNDRTEWLPAGREAELLQPGDILVTRTFAPGLGRGAVVREADLPAVANEYLLYLRPKGEVPELYVQLILTYLRSGVLDRIATRTANMSRVSVPTLADVRLPERDDTLTEALEEIVVAGEELRRWSEEAAAVVGGIFGFDGSTRPRARGRVIEAGQLLRLRANAASQLDDFGYTVRTRFPYPIALRWREVEARVSSEDLRRAYTAVLAAAEILLAYCALLTAALAREASIELSNVAALRNKFIGRGGGGPGIGEWTVILQEISGERKRRGLPDEHPLHDLGQLLNDDDAEEARKRLAKRRNNESHERRVDDVDLPTALAGALEDLKLLLRRAMFLADMPLIEVTSVDWNSFRNEASLGFRRLMGDHPVVPTETMKHGSSAVERHSLYLVGRDRSLHLLRPFLVGKVCSECRTWSTFHVDKVEGKIVMKTLEHGHLQREADEVSLQEAGLL
ncbi:restriction endonuclease [Streptomyces sp. NPDC013433]|uniref:restriction endonuclease n=1 Tax=Streptomyces sp. NPDC013433 TaxID=3155604 RepID=UPI0034524562